MIWNRVKTTMLLGGLIALLMGVGLMIGSSVGMFIGFIIGMGINLGSYWFSDKIVLKMYKAKEVAKTHTLYRIVFELVQKEGMPMPKVYTISAPSPNAFATGRNPKNSAVAASESLLQILTEEEVRAVMAHELAHIKHRDTLIQTIAVGIAASIAMIAEFFQWMLIFGMGGDEDGGIGSLFGSLLLLILTPIIAMIIQLAISRQREYMADAGATRMVGSSAPLIRALQKLEAYANGSYKNHVSRAPTESLFIVNPFRKSGLVSLFSTHPATEERIKRMKEIRI